MCGVEQSPTAQRQLRSTLRAEGCSPTLSKRCFDAEGLNVDAQEQVVGGMMEAAFRGELLRQWQRKRTTLRRAALSLCSAAHGKASVVIIEPKGNVRMGTDLQGRAESNKTVCRQRRLSNLFVSGLFEVHGAEASGRASLWRKHKR